MTARIKFDDDKVVLIMWDEENEAVYVAVIDGDNTITDTISLSDGGDNS